MKRLFSSEFETLYSYSNVPTWFLWWIKRPRKRGKADYVAALMTPFWLKLRTNEKNKVNLVGHLRIKYFRILSHAALTGIDFYTATSTFLLKKNLSSAVLACIFIESWEHKRFMAGLDLSAAEFSSKEHLMWGVIFLFVCNLDQLP
jgi:hypothetical protein